MRKRVRILLAALLLCAVAVTAIMPVSYAEAESASASDFQMKGDLLVKYTGTASAVSIPTSVKKIGKEAFAGHTELVKVDIPAYVESIDYNAFSGCTSLETVKIPDTVTQIGNGAFSGCSSLKSITLGKKLEKLGNGVFAGCDSLGTANLSRHNTEFAYENGVIYSKDKKIVYCMLPGYAGETYKMPSSVEEIRTNAFWGCKKLKRVEIGTNVPEIPDYAFANCTSLEKVILPYSLHSIGLKAFSNCVNLGETQVPMSVSEIHRTAFDGCPRLTLVAEPGSYAAKYEESRDKSNVAQVESQDIGSAQNAGGTDGTDSGSTGDSGAQGSGGSGSGSGQVMGQSSIVGGSAFVFMDNSQSKVLSGNVNEEEDMDGAQFMASNGGTGFPKYTVVNDEKIASQAFYNDASLTEYQMPEGIREIGDFSFARSGLTAIRIPDGTTAIGYGAFYHCDNLSQVEIPSSVTKIEPSAFAATKWMEERLADKRNPFTIVGDGILIAYSGMNSQVDIPEGVKQIGAEVFKGNTRMASVDLPESLAVIGEDAFAGCSSLTSVSMGSGIREIKDRAFEGCPISTIKIPSSVQLIGLKAFDITEADKDSGTRVAVFLGKNLPRVSYEKTATRLTNGDYRDAVFKGLEVAVVDSHVTASDIAGSVLSDELGGFRGVICSVEQKAEGDTPGKLRIKFYSMPEAEISSWTVPGQVVLYGKTYELIKAEEEEPENIWNGTDGGTGSSDGSGSGDGNSGAASGSAGDASGNSGSGAAKTGGGRVTVELRSDTIPSAPAVTAEIPGENGDYILRIADNTAKGSDISTAYRKLSGGSTMKSLQVYDITLYEAQRRIPISKLGQQEIIVTIPKPRGILEENLRVVCLDGDGQLEQVESKVLEVNGQVCVQFKASHFSVFGIYNY